MEGIMTLASTLTDKEELLSRISLDGILEARSFIEGHLPRTPLLKHPLLDAALGLDIHVKHENHLPTGAFKVRGGVNLSRHLSEDECRHGVATATRGNHGQSIAYGCRLRGIRCVIVVPYGNNPEKNAAMKAYGAELMEYGDDFDEANGYCMELAKEEGLRYVHPGNEPELINGVGTFSLEVYEDLPEVDTIIFPVGGGSAICGGIAAFRSLKPGVEIIGVQAANAPSIYNSWLNGKRESTESADTFADGLATRIPFELPFEIIKDGVDKMVVVREEEIEDAIRLVWRTTHNMPEGAGATPFAAAYALREELEGKKVVAVLSGANIDTETLARVFNSRG